jgi:hypothetical protein
MATYYVRKTGNNGNAGTSAGAAWLTVTKAVQTVTSGDTVYVGAGVYRETVQITVTPASAVTMIADVDGANTGDIGEVRITGYTTNDKTAATSTAVLDLNSKGWFIWKYFVFQSGAGRIVSNTGSGICVNSQFIDCTFINLGLSNNSINLTTSVQDTAPNWLIDRCRFIHNGTTNDCIYLDVITPTAADLSTGIIIRNSVFLFCGNNGGIGTVSVVYFNPSLGAGGSGGSFFPGDVQFYNNTVFGGYNCLATGSNAATSIPMRAYNNFVCTDQNAFNANTTGQIVEDFNMVYTNVANTNVTTGTNTKGTAYAPLVHIGQELQQGKLLRPMFMPTEDSPFLGYGNHTTYTSGVDILNRIRPAGGGTTWASSGKAVGAYERHDFGAKEVSVIDAATGAIKWRGPGDQRLYIPVNAASTSISIKNRYDSSYGGGTKPTFRLETNNEIGVTTQATTTTGAANTYNTMTLPSFTPTGKGWVIVTMESYAAGTGLVYWDTLSVQ